MENAIRVSPNRFERHPKVTLAVVWLALLLLFTVAVEIALRNFSGLGHPVLFYAHPSFGYRMKPNQETWRFEGAHFKINNLGLRANRDWDTSPAGKILFLGDSVTYGGNHISNEDLFSSRAVDGLTGFQGGNAGIPNWGVENVYGLVVQEQFLPASVYVTTFIEDDFYRGLQLGENMPWIKYEQPRFALQELAEFCWYKFIRPTYQTNRRKLESEPRDVRALRAAAKLRAMDDFLKARGYRELIFISPTREQVLGEQAVDPRVKADLEKEDIHAVYLLDRLAMHTASPQERRSWFQDDVHLTMKGHAVWGELIRAELARQLQVGGAPLAKTAP